MFKCKFGGWNKMLAFIQNHFHCMMPHFSTDSNSKKWGMHLCKTKDKTWSNNIWYRFYQNCTFAGIKDYLDIYWYTKMDAFYFMNTRNIMTGRSFNNLMNRFYKLYTIKNKTGNRRYKKNSQEFHAGSFSEAEWLLLT